MTTPIQPSQPNRIQSEQKDKAPAISVSRGAFQASGKEHPDLRRQAIDQNIPLFALIDWAADPNFEKNPNRADICKLIGKQFAQKNLSLEEQAKILSKLLSSGQTPETVFKNLDLIFGDKFFTLLKEIREKFPDKESKEVSELVKKFSTQLFSLAFEKPKIATDLATKHKGALKNFNFNAYSVTDVFLKYNSPGTEHSKNVDILDAIKILRQTKALDSFYVSYILLSQDLSVEHVFRSLELLNPSAVFNIAKHKDISKNFTTKFFTLMFQNPKFALDLINKHKERITNFPFTEKEMGEVLKTFESIGIDNGRDKDLAECLKVMMKNAIATSTDYKYLTLLKTFVICDVPLSYGAVISNIADNWWHGSRTHILNWDAVECLKALGAAGYNIDVSWRAAQFQSPKCVAYLVEKYGKMDDQTHEHYLKKWKEQGNIAPLLGIFKSDYKEVANVLFSDVLSDLEPFLKNPAPYQKKIEEKLKDIFVKLLRMNPFALVDRVVDSFMAQNPVAAELFPAIYQKVKKEASEVLPFIARYTQASDMADVRNVYSAKSTKSQLTEELEYAAFGRQQVEELTEKLKTNQLKAPKNPDFAQLPPSKTGTRRAAALLETIGEIRSARQAARSVPSKNSFGKDVVLCMKSLRKGHNTTELGGRYAWASPLINAVELLSDAPDVVHNSSLSYSMTYKGETISVVRVKKEEYHDTQQWFHGIMDVEKTWQAVEDTFEKLMAFDLKKPADNDPAAIKKYQQQLDAFYENAAELVWLIGNTTPLERGSGTVAEWLLAIVHRQHGLEPPVLKTDFPQIDCLDITFPLSDYKHFFTYFFEPSTLPEHIKWPDLSGKSLMAQMEFLYADKRAKTK